MRSNSRLTAVRIRSSMEVVMSDLSRLRARWARLERRVANLQAEYENERDLASDHELSVIDDKLTDAQAKLRLTIEQVHAEERRIGCGP